MTQPRGRAELAQLIRIAELVRAGAPFGEIGRVEPNPAPNPRADLGRPTLALASGVLDDRRRELTPEDEMYGLFEHALLWQDTWSEDEHGSFWQGALALWPSNRGKHSHTHALAYAIAIAVYAGVDLEAFLRLLSRELRGKAITGLTAEEFTLPDLQRRDAVRIAIEMIAGPRHLHPDSGRLPRVVTDEEIIPHLAVAYAELDRYGKAGEASGEIIRAAERAVRRLPVLPPPDARSPGS